MTNPIMLITDTPLFDIAVVLGFGVALGFGAVLGGLLAVALHDAVAKAATGVIGRRRRATALADGIDALLAARNENR